ncbi:DUF4179 domain-containing protein [Paenibacillus luteus]|uniref:DUF4179 domain-containing protein n=1 Tax=Paenibacillus luteus TaxID=2545753 RepID=UPI001144DCAB|nr:DUF4179 domain-containing protein [Paenibacillus luteus]
MKDVYELLNDMDIDEHEFVEMEVNELEKAKVKRALKESIVQKRKMRSWKKPVAAAVMVVGLSTATLGLTFPAYAVSLPVIGNIFKILDVGKAGVYDHYQEYSTEMNLTAESNGIKVIINNAIFDGETVALTYSIESNQDLGESPYLRGLLNMKGSTGGAGGSKISKVDSSRYVGITTETGFFKGQKPDTVNMKWQIDSIVIQENQEEIKGKWSFAFALEATEADTQVIGQSSEHDGVAVQIGELSVTPMSFIVHYDQLVSEEIRNKWHGVDVDIEVKDDLGNLYSGKGNGGTGDKEGYHTSWSKTFEKLDPNAAKLILTPQIRLYEYTSENYGSVEETKDGPQSAAIPEKSGKGEEKFKMEDIVIDLSNR